MTCSLWSVLINGGRLDELVAYNSPKKEVRFGKLQRGLHWAGVTGPSEGVVV